MRAACCATDFSTGPTLVQPCGPTPPTARGRTRRSWRATASPVGSIARSPSAARCLYRSAAPMAASLLCAVAHRACLRRAEGQNGPLHPNHRTRSGTTQDRARQPRLQHQTLHLVEANCGGDIEGPQGSLPTTIKRRSPTSRKDPKSF